MLDFRDHWRMTTSGSFPALVLPRPLRTKWKQTSISVVHRSPTPLSSGQTRQSAVKDEKKNKKYDSSLFLAIHQSSSSVYAHNRRLDTLKTTTPLLNKVILTWLTDSYIYSHLSDDQRTAGIVPKPKGIGYGIGLAVALFAMQEVASLMTNHYMQTSMTTGLSVRTAIIGNVFRKSLRLSGRAKLSHSVGQITTMISADATRLDLFSAYAHNLWVSPIQIIIGVGLLINNLGYSALVGLGVLLLGFPIQMLLVRVMFNQRKKGVGITDTRIRLTTEVLQGIRLIKFYAWEGFYTGQIGKLREREIKTIRKSAIARSGLIAMVTFIPVLASVLSFITYALSGHDLNIAIIFSSLQFFNIIRAPLIFFPFVLSSLSDALVALGRISKFLTAEELADPYLIDYEGKLAVEVEGTFAWEEGGKLEEPKFSSERGAGQRGGRGKTNAKIEKAKTKKQSKNEGTPVLPISTADGEEEKGGTGTTTPEIKAKPFELNNLKFSVGKGAFIAIVGRSSVLQALIGEMRRTQGKVVFGGTVAYVPQTPWIRNATLRENILFGQEDDEDKSVPMLEHDLEMLPHGEDTEIGEKGINLSGGQKARISMARAAYSESDVVLLDDPLSAVDAYVGKAILEECLLNGPLADRTRILVTHALHVLDKTDYIYVMENGVMTEQGTYDSLMKDSVVFSRLMDEYGNLEQEEKAEGGAGKRKAERGTAGDTDGADNKKANAALMQAEERNIGSVSWDTYKKYLRFAGGIFWAPVILILLTITQGAQVGNNLFLGFWTVNSIPGFRQGDYMAVYAALGTLISISLLATHSLYSRCCSGALLFHSEFYIRCREFNRKLNLFKAALSSVLRSPTSFFDTTPMGRILSRLSKDQDTLDTELAVTLWQFLSTFSSVLGTVAWCSIHSHYSGSSSLPWQFYTGWSQCSIDVLGRDQAADS
ncbi:hypothetical protein BD779DRAFT_1675113 [Infundibulicybe gibba]|nr:hypothetical protein BD779DRAFT_1675113 [Infundibulicybe gibba]